MPEVSNTSNTVIGAHYSNEVKVKRPNIAIADAPQYMLKNPKPFSEDEAKQKLLVINEDIYTRTKKEKSNREFDKKLFFKIFGGITFTALLIAGIRKLKKFFRKS